MQEMTSQHGPGKKLRLSPTDLKCIHQAIDYVYMHYMEKISADQLSIQAGLSKDKLQAGFQRMTGDTLHKYIQQIRLQKAIELLITTNDPLKLVDGASGFGNESHFCKVFKKLHLISPAQYRYRQFG